MIKPIRLYVFGRNGDRYAGFLTEPVISGCAAWGIAGNALYAKLGLGWTVVAAEVL